MLEWLAVHWWAQYPIGIILCLLWSEFKWRYL
jgi:hypothetical protein